MAPETPYTEAVVDASRDEVTRLLVAHRAGDRRALGQLLPLVYRDLRHLARRQLGRGRPGQTLDTTSLVHEAYLKLADAKGTGFEHRGHFFAVASMAMRQIVVDYARYHNARKRGGDRPLDRLDGVEIAVEQQAGALLELDRVLDRLGTLDERLPRIVECRFFAGLTAEETAGALGVSLRTVERDWKRARAWLRREFDAGPGGAAAGAPPSPDGR
jgi:RNA polymerase sigma factor (TIGR02999 family)